MSKNKPEPKLADTLTGIIGEAKSGKLDYVTARERVDAAFTEAGKRTASGSSSRIHIVRADAHRILWELEKISRGEKIPDVSTDRIDALRDSAAEFDQTEM